jgi:hypothetical protein
MPVYTRPAWRFGILAWGLVSCPPDAALAQEPRGFEAGLQGITTLAEPRLAGGGLTGAWRPGGRMRLVVGALPGVTGRRFAFRGELGAHFLLNPTLVRGLGFYGMGGIAGVAARRSAGYLMLGVGAETSPAGRSGWMVELGVGGGGRIAVGWRRRWLSLIGPP